LSAALGLQMAVILILALAAATGWGLSHAGHLVLGGLAVWMPNALFALRLFLHRDRRAESYPAIFFVGEFAKIGLTVGLLALTVRYVPDLQWGAWLVGVIAAVKAPLLFGLGALRPAGSSTDAGAAPGGLRSGF
jgi:ATP synthase protein I